MCYIYTVAECNRGGGQREKGREAKRKTYEG